MPAKEDAAAQDRARSRILDDVRTMKMSILERAACASATADRRPGPSEVPASLSPLIRVTRKIQRGTAAYA
jgi:hypothetical protein